MSNRFCQISLNGTSQKYNLFHHPLPNHEKASQGVAPRTTSSRKKRKTRHLSSLLNDLSSPFCRERLHFAGEQNLFIHSKMQSYEIQDFTPAGACLRHFFTSAAFTF